MLLGLVLLRSNTSFLVLAETETSPMAVLCVTQVFWLVDEQGHCGGGGVKVCRCAVARISGVNG